MISCLAGLVPSVLAVVSDQCVGDKIFTHGTGMARCGRRKTLLSVISNKEGERIQKEIGVIRKDTVHVKDGMNPFDSTELVERLMKKKKAALFINVTKDQRLVMGRTFNDEVIDMVEFTIDSYRSVSSFGCAGPELHAKYYVILQNINDSRMENLIVDLFNMKSAKVCLESIRYAWVFAKSEVGYVLKYVRILRDLSVEDCGPMFEMALARSYHCDEELYKKAIDEPVRSRKGVKTNEFRDKVGKIHVDKQDLRDVRLRRTRGYKNKGSPAETE